MAGWIDLIVTGNMSSRDCNWQIRISCQGWCLGLVSNRSNDKIAVQGVVSVGAWAQWSRTVRH